MPFHFQRSILAAALRVDGGQVGGAASPGAACPQTGPRVPCPGCQQVETSQAGPRAVGFPGGSHVGCSGKGGVGSLAARSGWAAWGEGADGRVRKAVCTADINVSWGRSLTVVCAPCLFPRRGRLTWVKRSKAAWEKQVGELELGAIQ